jgi:hypothetical protein
MPISKNDKAYKSVKMCTRTSSRGDAEGVLAKG